MPTLTTKGQVTIPREIRRRLRVQAGDEVRFVVRGSKVEVERAPGAGTSLYGLLAGGSTRGDDRPGADDGALLAELMADDDRIRGAGR